MNMSPSGPRRYHDLQVRRKERISQSEQNVTSYVSITANKNYEYIRSQANLMFCLSGVTGSSVLGDGH